MSGHEPTLKNKVSPHIEGQLPEFVQSDHPLFSLFLKYYYEFLEAGELSLSGTNNYVIEETLTKNFILEEDGEKVVLEDSTGKFIVGETIVGQRSNATARVLVDDFDDNNRLFITSQQLFETGENVVGQTSGAIAPVTSYRANPVQNIQQLLAYADVDNTVYSFLDRFRDSFMDALPNTLADGIAKRNLIKNIKDMYAAKGTADGHKLFFRILLDEEATIIYPRDNLLRPSDGQWSTDKIMRVVESGTADFTNAVGQIITGATSGAKALISTVVKFREGATVIAELNLDRNSIVGTFQEGETISATDPEIDQEIFATVKSMVISGVVTTGGAYYETNDSIIVDPAAGNGAAIARVDSAGAGSIDEIMIEDGGSGYAVGDTLVFDNTGTEGKDASARVAVVGGGLLLEPDTAPDHLITESGELIITDDDIQYLQQEETVGELDHLVLENGDQIILEEETFNDLGVSAEIGEITKIDMINVGNGYIKLPTVTVDSGSSGTGASLFAASTVSPMVGHVEGVAITNFGLEYSSAPSFTFNRNLLVKNVTGSFIAGDTLTSHSGTIVNFNDSTNVLEIRSSVTFNKDETITTITGASATVYQADTAVATSEVGIIGTTVAGFITDRGKVSVEAMRIQDSFYYQDYSYVVQIGESINQWRDSVRQSVHPAGWNVFGQVSFASLVSAAIQVPAAGDVAGFDADTETYSPELASTFENLFTTIFGRRLGTTTDGSVPSASPKVGVGDIADMTDGERDVTLTQTVVVSLHHSRGSHWTGHTSLANLPKYAFAVPPISTAAAIPNYPGINRIASTSENQTRDLYTIAQFGHIGIRDVCLADGSIPDSAFATRINVPPPSEIIITTTGTPTFDRSSFLFDETDETFDEA